MKLSIEGYKSIAEKRSINLCGLTILAGANSSGKSSFMQPFLLIKQTLENDFDAGVFLLDGPNVKLADSSDILSKVSCGNGRQFVIALTDAVDEICVSYNITQGQGIAIADIYYQNYKSERFKEGIRVHQNLAPSQIAALAALIGGPFAPSNTNNPQLQVTRNRCFLELKAITGSQVPVAAIFSLAHHLGHFATRLIHVPGLRGNPERSYKTTASESTFPGSFENYLASTLHKWKSNPEHQDKFARLGQYLQQLGLASSIDTVRINESKLEIRVSRHHSAASDRVNIADVGLGMSQTLPVLVALLAAGQDQCVYIEQPELHLHPRAQFALAHVLAEAVSERKIKLVIETHSAILIRGIQILVAKRQLAPDLVSLNWFSQNPSTGQTDIVEAKLDEYGAFGDWPEDFDSTALEVETLYLDAVEAVFANEI